MKESKYIGDIKKADEQVMEITDKDFLEGKEKLYVFIIGADDIESMIEHDIQEIMNKTGGKLSNMFVQKIVGDHIEIYPIKNLEIYY